MKPVLLKKKKVKKASVAWEGRQHMHIQHMLPECIPAAPFICGTAVKTVIPQRVCQGEQVI